MSPTFGQLQVRHLVAYRAPQTRCGLSVHELERTDYTQLERNVTCDECKAAAESDPA